MLLFIIQICLVWKSDTIFYSFHIFIIALYILALKFPHSTPLLFRKNLSERLGTLFCPLILLHRCLKFQGLAPTEVFSKTDSNVYSNTCHVCYILPCLTLIFNKLKKIYLNINGSLTFLIF